MKLEIGKFIRTPYGIRKIVNITKDDGYGKPKVRVIELDRHLNTPYKFDYIFYTDDNVIKKCKASYNIIDLIEEKDLLEIEYYSLRYEKRVTRLFEVTYKEGRFINLDNAKCQFMLIDNDWTDNDKELEPIIKSIVTKEQFESMSYRIGE